MVKFKKIDKRGNNLAIFRDGNHAGAIAYYNDAPNYRLFQFGTEEDFTTKELSIINRKINELNGNQEESIND